MYDDGQCRKPVLCLIASDVFRLQSSKYKKYDLVISASFFEIYSGKVVHSVLSYLMCFFFFCDVHLGVANTTVNHLVSSLSVFVTG